MQSALPNAKSPRTLAANQWTHRYRTIPQLVIFYSAVTETMQWYHQEMGESAAVVLHALRNSCRTQDRYHRWLGHIILQQRLRFRHPDIPLVAPGIHDHRLSPAAPHAHCQNKSTCSASPKPDDDDSLWGWVTMNNGQCASTPRPPPLPTL